MNYATTNKILKRGTKRTIVGQVAWAVVFLGCLAPASYLFGYFHTRDKFDTLKYGEAMSQTAQRPPERVEPPREISMALQPFGTTNVEASALSGRQIWRAEYNVSRNKTDKQLLAQVVRAWGKEGLRTQLSNDCVTGWSKRTGTMFVAHRNGEEMFDIFAYEKATSEPENPDEVFHSNDLPMPPRGAEVVNCSGAGAGNVVTFRAYRRGEQAAQEYLREMKTMGWADVSASARETAEQYGAAGFVGMLQKGDRHATITTMAEPRGNQLISLVIF